MSTALVPIPQKVGIAGRMMSVDVLRGATVAFMILVSNPGDWNRVYNQLEHATWNGFTIADLVFPNLLFVMGISIVFSLQNRIRRGLGGRKIVLHILGRTLALFALDLFLELYPHFHFQDLRLYGVLTRVALCYFFAGLSCAYTMRARTLMLAIMVCLFGYYVFMRFIPLPGVGLPTETVPILDPMNNFAALIDRYLSAGIEHHWHIGSLYDRTHDPEGLFSTLPAIGTTLFGSIAALWIRPETRVPRYWRGINIERAGLITSNKPGRCLTGLILTGLSALTAGLIADIWFPINRNLWTSSYVLFAAGWSLLLLAASYYVIDIRHAEKSAVGKALIEPCMIFGTNPLMAYVVSVMVAKTLLWVRIPGGPKPVTAWAWLYRHTFAIQGSTELSSLAFGLAFTALCLLPNWVLYRRKLYVSL
jgi:predicted acyltransferase